MNPSDPWERLLVNSLARDFQQMRLGFLAGLSGQDLDAAVGTWLTEQAPRVAQFRVTVDRARLVPNPNGAMLSHLAGQAREIGRASCRARVCQYVYISVVAVSLKKKKKYKRKK